MLLGENFVTVSHQIAEKSENKLPKYLSDEQDNQILQTVLHLSRCKHNILRDNS